MPDGNVGIRVSEGRAGFAGLVSCGSVWVCPVCQCKIMARRALEIGLVVAGATAEEIPVGFFTLTSKHKRRDSLAKSWDAVAGGWSRVAAGKGWALDRQNFGIVGYVRAVEVTDGENGWHPHVHALIPAHGLDNETIDELGDSMWNRWSSGVQKAGALAPLSKASDWQLVGGDLSGTKLGEYLAKGAGAAGALGMELTMTQSKVARARHSTHSVWEILQQAIDGEVAGLARWWEWEQASKGRRQIAWSRGIRARFALEAEKTDDEVAAEEVGSDDDTVVVITSAGWCTLIETPALLPEVLMVAESDTTEGLSDWLTARGVEHWRV